MAKKTVGALIKEARTNAGMTQEQLAKKVSGVTASDISKAERDVAPLSQEALKQIAKATNVTQKSLLEAAKTTKYSSSSKESESKSSRQSVSVTNAEKKLLTMYRKADANTKAVVLKILENTTDSSNPLGGLLSSKAGEETLSTLLQGAKELFGK